MFVIQQLIETLDEGKSASERIEEHISRILYVVVKPDETMKVDFGISVLCAELDEFNGQLKTYAWQSMVR